MSSIYIPVKVRPGVSVNEACLEAVILATRMEIDVRFKFNDVTLTAVPARDVSNATRKLVEKYDSIMRGDEDDEEG